MKLMNENSILMALEAFHVGGSKANDQSRGSVEEGVWGGGHSTNAGERLMSVCTQVVALGMDKRSNYKMLRRQNWDDYLLAEEVRGKKRNISGVFTF